MTGAYACADHGLVQPADRDLSTLISSQILLAGPMRVVQDPPPIITGLLTDAPPALAGSDTVYVSMRPGSLPDVPSLLIENGNLDVVTVTLRDGGFDPVPIVAEPGDLLRITAETLAGKSEPVIVKVPAARPPTVVRSSPPRGRTAVSLNSLVTIIFSQPMDRASLDSKSVRLLRNGIPVAGTLVQHADSWIVDFVPRQNLDPNAPYVLVISGGVRDRSGVPMGSDYTVDFETGTSYCGQADGGCTTDDPSANVLISGNVILSTATGDFPVPDALLSVWVTPSQGNAYGLMDIPVDSAGHYQITLPANAEVTLSARSPGLEQHCMNRTQTYSGPRKQDIQLSPPGYYTGQGIHQEVHARQWNGSYPYGAGIPGTRMAFEIPRGFEVVWGTTDAAGDVQFCGLPHAFLAGMISWTKDGYVPGRWPMQLSGDIDIWIGMTIGQ